MRVSRWVAIGVAISLSAAASAQTPNCVAAPGDAAAVSAAVEAWYDALRNEDAKKFASVTSADFYAFEVGERVTGPQLYELVTKARRDGAMLEWNVGPLDVRFGCGTAWASWENKGRAGKAPDVRPARWLESAAFRRVRGRWIMEFLHSTPARPAR